MFSNPAPAAERPDRRTLLKHAGLKHIRTRLARGRTSAAG